MKTTNTIILTAFLLFVFVACDKVDNPPTPPQPIKSDCIISSTSTTNNSTGYIFNLFYYSAQRRLDSTRNPYTFTIYHYQDSLLVKREVQYTNGRQVRNYDSLFYNTDGTLQRIKLVDWDNTDLIFVNDINLSFTYTNGRLTRMLTSDLRPNNTWRDVTTDYTYDAKSNIIQANHSYTGGASVDKYYYSDTLNYFPKLKTPIGLLLHNEGLSLPLGINSRLPMYLSPYRMNRWYDSSDNDIDVSITGGPDDQTSTSIQLRLDNFLMYTISLNCQ